VTITAQQLVDAVRLLRYSGVFMDDAEADRLSPYRSLSRDRYEKLKRTASFEECDMIASAEMLAGVLGLSPDGIEADVRDRFRRQMEAWKAQLQSTGNE
jgi:hypothetical protein